MRHIIEEAWQELEDSFPQQTDERLLFFNRHLDIYTVQSLEGLETELKRFRQNFGYIMDNDDDNPDLAEWVRKRYRFTHYRKLPEPPV